MKIWLSILIFVLFSTSICLAQEGVISTLKFKDADIRIVLQAITQKAVKDNQKINILISPDIKGMVTVDLENVDWQTALDAVLKTYNYGYEWTGRNIILVDTLDSLAEKRKKSAEAKVAEPLDSKVYNLSFAKVDDVRPIVQGMLTGRGRMVSDSRTNTLVLTDVQSNIPALEQTIKALDAITPQVEIEAKVIETDLDASKKLGLKWNLGSSSSGTPSSVMSGSKWQHAWPFSHVSDENWVFKDMPAIASSELFTYGTLDASSLSVAMQILFSDTNTKILSMPRITTMDNNTATIDVIREDPFPNYTYNAERGSWEISGYTFIKYGVTLEVTPQINKEGYITLTVKPRISEKYTDKEFTSQTGTSASIPVIDTQTTSTKVMIKDGETLVIAGLVRDKTEEAVTKVPLLGDIPLLGYFFKHKSKTTVQKNLMIFITPKIVTPTIIDPTAQPVANTQAVQQNNGNSNNAVAVTKPVEEPATSQ